MLSLKPRFPVGHPRARSLLRARTLPPVAASSPGAFSTTFATDENPLNGTVWLRGESDGGYFTDPLATGGRAIASRNSDTGRFIGRYDDSIACIKPAYQSFTPDQWAQGVVYRSEAGALQVGKHEVELLLRWSITTNAAYGYELLWSGVDGGIAIVKWRGGGPTYTPLHENNTGAFDADDGNRLGVPVDGDVLRFEVSGTGAGITFKIYKNEIDMYPDRTITDWEAADRRETGQPGLGFWPVDGADRTKYGWKDWSGGVLYTTDFNTDEATLSEGGKWVSNASPWKRVEVSGGVARAAAYTDSYDDAYAILNSWAGGEDYEIVGTIHNPNGLTSGEVELLLRCTDDSTHIYCYECLFAIGASMQFVRWNGPYVGSYPSAQFDLLEGTQDTTPFPNLADGSQVRATVQGTLIKVFARASPSVAWTQYAHYDFGNDATKFTTGKPGIGLYVHTGDANRTLIGLKDVKVSAL